MSIANLNLGGTAEVFYSNIFVDKTYNVREQWSVAGYQEVVFNYYFSWLHLKYLTPFPNTEDLSASKAVLMMEQRLVLMMDWSVKGFRGEWGKKAVTGK